MLEEKILNDYKEAMKSRDKVKTSILSFLRSKINYEVMQKNKEHLDDNECLSVIKKLIKQHQDSIEQFTKGGRFELAEKEKEELRILEEYLPPQLSSDELNKIIEEVISSTSAAGIKDMGKVMKEVKERVGEKADGRVMSEAVRERLSRSQ